MREDVQKTEDKTPIIGDIPLVGRLFRTNVDQHIKRNLVIFVTARVITPAFEYEDVLALGLGSAGRDAAIRFVEPSSGQVVALRPDITPQIARLIAPFRERAETQVATLKIRLRPEEADNPAVNKVVCAADGRALYFSRYPVPYDREGRGVLRYKHVGLYAYTRAALETFHRLPPSPLELAENLEQLRFLEHGIPIFVVETDEPTIGVDTEADLRAAEARLASRRS